MICFKTISKFCKDDISLIENYKEAVNSSETWDCHHRLETDLGLSAQELKDGGLYYNRPASELIFLTHPEHTRLHKLYSIQTVETRHKISETAKISQNKADVRIKKSESLKGRTSPMKGKTPWNKGLHFKK